MSPPSRTGLPYIGPCGAWRTSSHRSVHFGEDIRGVAKFDEALIEFSTSFLNFLSPRGGYFAAGGRIQTFDKSFGHERSRLRG